MPGRPRSATSARGTVRPCLLGAALAALGVAATGGEARAHKNPPLRAVTLQVEAQGVVALWRAEIGGPPATLLRANHDRDRDGQLSETERLRLAASVMAKAMRGVEIRLDGTLAKLADLDARVEEAPSGKRLTILALATLEFEKPPAVARRTLWVEVSHGEGLAVSAQGLEGWRLRQTSRGAVAPRGALGEPVNVARNERLILTFEHVEE